MFPNRVDDGDGVAAYANARAHMRRGRNQIGFFTPRSCKNIHHNCCVFAVALGLCTHTSVLFRMLRAIAALLAASGAAGLVPTRRSVARVINAGGEEDYVNPVTEFLGRFIPKQAPLELGVDWDQPKTPLPLGELAGALDRGLREREWFVTGKVLPEYFSDDFKFEDPDVSFSA